VQLPSAVKSVLRLSRPAQRTATSGLSGSIQRGKNRRDARCLQIHPRKDNRGVDLLSDVLPFGKLWYAEPNAVDNAIGYAKFYSRSHDAVIRVFDAAGAVIKTEEHTGDFREF